MTHAGALSTPAPGAGAHLILTVGVGGHLRLCGGLGLHSGDFTLSGMCG